MRVVVLLLVCVGYCSAESKETFRARLNPSGVNTAENLMRSMIVKVNDLIRVNSNLPNMQIGPVAVEGFSVRTLDTSQVSFIMNPINTIGLALANGRVHLTATVAVYVPIFIGQIRVAGVFDTYGDGIQATLQSGMGVKAGHLNALGMGCTLRVDRPRVDLHNPLINHFANAILQGLMPSVTQGVCNGVKQFGTGMANSVFQMIPTNINVFNMFRLEFPVVNFRIWNRHIVGGLGMEVKRANNVGVNKGGLRVRALPEAEDGHMACSAVSEFVINTATRTFLPKGHTINLNVASVMNLFVKDLFKFAIFVRGTITNSPMLTIENGQISISVGTKGVMTNSAGKAIAGTEIKPTMISVTCPANETPMFSNVRVQLTGAFNMRFNVNIANVIDMILGIVNKKAAQYGRVVKRASNADLTRAVDKMFFGEWFTGFNMKLSAKQGAVLVCMSGNPNPAATNKVYKLLRSSFYHG